MDNPEKGTPARPHWTYLHWWCNGYRSSQGGWMVRILSYWFYIKGPSHE